MSGNIAASAGGAAEGGNGGQAGDPRGAGNGGQAGDTRGAGNTGENENSGEGGEAGNGGENENSGEGGEVREGSGSDGARRHRRLRTELKESMRELSVQLSLLNAQVSTRLELRESDVNCLDVISRHGPIEPECPGAADRTAPGDHDRHPGPAGARRLDQPGA